MPATREFLDLLAREAAPVEFEGPLIAARTAGLPADEVAELEEAKLVALRVRSLLGRRRRREEELSALYDTANDLAGLRQLDAVLTAIVRRARTLLGTDVAYMTLTDTERGDTAMRVTDGSVSARFQNLRLGMGEGLGGLVSQTARPYVTANYPKDSRFKHTGTIDAGVGEEGLIAILGVPLRLGSSVIGVLYAANRTERPFAREEVALLVSLAAHAAVAIDTTRLLDETRTALQELSSANAVIRAHSASVERAAAAHDRMSAIVLRGGGLEDVAAAVTELFGGTLVVYDDGGRTLYGTDTHDPSLIAEAVAASRHEGRSVLREGVWVAPVVAGTEVLGALALRPDVTLVDADQRILERAAVVTALLQLFARNVAEAEGRVRGDLLDDLLTYRDHSSDALRTRAARLGIDLDRPHVLVVLAADDDPLRQRTFSWASTYASSRGGLAAARQTRIALLLPGCDPGAASRAVIRDLARIRPTDATAGAAGPTTDPAEFAGLFRDADRVASALIALGRAGDGASAGEMGFVGLLLGDDRDVTGFIDRTIGPLLAYDTRRGTALVATLQAYFTVGTGLARAAEVLHVHVNTVTQRLDRIAQLLGADWQKPERALEIQLALRLHAIGPSLAAR
ncbi:MAG TPA: GAF domain-containing protein [Micromonosporaceae bacterium]|nr:GAF domain-containing protein [Micromonosporaceae bacterium]